MFLKDWHFSIVTLDSCHKYASLETSMVRYKSSILGKTTSDSPDCFADISGEVEVLSLRYRINIYRSIQILTYALWAVSRAEYFAGFPIRSAS